MSDDSPGKPTDFGSRDPAYRPYDGAGVWRGGFPYMGLYAAHLDALPQESPASAQLASLSLREVRGSCKLLTIADFGQGPAVLSGSHYGGLYYFPRKAGAPLQFSRRVHLVDPMGIAQRHPTVGAAPLAYPNSSGKKTDLIVGGEGGLYFYAFSGEFSPAGKPIYAPPVYALEEPADLYAGTLPVPNAVDWDGDGDIDLVAGNSEGRVLFFENTGGNQAPAFQPGTPIQADGHPIHIQPGYRDDIQGPGEARWGYTCPAVLDWNGDGPPRYPHERQHRKAPGLYQPGRRRRRPAWIAAVPFTLTISISMGPGVSSPPPPVSAIAWPMWPSMMTMSFTSTGASMITISKKAVS